MAEEQQSPIGKGSTSHLQESIPEHVHAEPFEAELRNEKLKLEAQLLRQQIRPRSFLIELAKSVTGPVAVIGLIFTVYLGVVQLRETRHSRDEERFDKAITRLAGPSPTERLTGLAGLQLFLEPDQKERHRGTAHFLANALGSEHDPTVSGALLNALSQLRPKEVGHDVLNDTLETLRDQNRSLYKQLRAAFLDKLKHDAKAITQADDETGIGKVSEENLIPLRATSSAIAAVILNGARTKDLSDIYCVDCDFSGKVLDRLRPDYAQIADFAALKIGDSVDLSGTDFHNAILGNANFTGVNLRSTSFDGADLRRTNFSGADLKGAKFTDYEGGHCCLEPFYPHEYVLQSVVVRGMVDQNNLFPNFTCADLSDADFTGSILFGIFQPQPDSAVFGAYPILYNANLANTKLGDVRVFTATGVPQGLSPSNPFFEGFLSLSQHEYQAQRDTTSHKGFFTIFRTGTNFQVKEPIRSEKWRFLDTIFGNLASARNLERSDLPPHLKEFIRKNQWPDSPYERATPCTPRG
jgi:uncharacterized protein YjbI with pentapeptide repeats